MTRTASERTEELRAAISGEVLCPGDPGYDDARRVWNAAIDARPAVIARCRTARDVAAAVQMAAQQGLDVAVRGGAHSVSGQCVVDDGLMIDLSLIDGVSVDPEARRARVGGGALLGALIEAAQEHGLATPVGAISHTGVGGLTLGGGMGWLSRKHGLSIDNLVSAEVVCADGRIRRASADENADLFWGLRGGGGNFGVVTEFEFDLHPVGPMIAFTMMFWALADGHRLLQLARDVVGSLPPEVNVVIAGLNAPPEPFVPEQHQLQPGYALIVTGFGSADEHEPVVARLREGLPPLWEFSTPMPYVAVQQMLDEANAWGQYNYDKGMFLEELTDDAIEVITQHVPRKSSPLSLTLFYRLDAAYAAVPDDATAFSGRRTPCYAVFIIAVCPVPELLDAERSWVRAFHAALREHATDVGTYVNALDGMGGGEAVLQAYGSDKLERLAGIKQKYDPMNLFRRNANILPAGAATQRERQSALAD